MVVKINYPYQTFTDTTCCWISFSLIVWRIDIVTLLLNVLSIINLASYYPRLVILLRIKKIFQKVFWSLLLTKDIIFIEYYFEQVFFVRNTICVYERRFVISSLTILFSWFFWIHWRWWHTTLKYQYFRPTWHSSRLLNILF